MASQYASAPAPALAWGFDGHRLIMSRAIDLLPAEERLSHIVVMGMGEPLANLDNLLPALDFASDDAGDEIGASHLDNEKQTMSIFLLNEVELTGVTIE